MERTKRRLAGWLLVVMGALALAGLYFWTAANNEQTASAFGAKPADHTSATVLFILAGVALLLSVILYSSLRDEDEETPATGAGESTGDASSAPM